MVKRAASNPAEGARTGNTSWGTEESKNTIRFGSRPMAYKLDPEAFHRILSFRARYLASLDSALVRWIDFSTGHGFYHAFRNPAGPRWAT
ncbi:MAG TPA: hypothetical protein VF548_15835 [Allosphingosinicella sp.]|jgi:regulator of sirC expression with transglutaminase-like and TPR domain